MSGIYLHIPFCKKACHYCDFHFSTSLRLKDDLLECLKIEISRNREIVGSEIVETIYFGGGTPSILSAEELKSILDVIKENYEVSANAEITLEANPDDIDQNKADSLREIGINRLSIGIQSFRDEDLKLMNRAHDAALAHRSLEIVSTAGFKNITIDLIYGIPGLSLSDWEKNISEFLKYNIPHLSAYNLTYEDRTAFGHWKKTGKIIPEEDDLVISQFRRLMQLMEGAGYHHYEISNFAKPGYESLHNSAYWTGKKYLGLGPGAHSFDGSERRWNISNNALYIKGIKEGRKFSESETLSENDRYNEYILTGLRTSNGCDLGYVKEKFGVKRLEELKALAAQYEESGELSVLNERIILTEKGKFVADKIASDFFAV